MDSLVNSDDITRFRARVRMALLESWPVSGCHHGQDAVNESDVVDWQSFCETRGDEHPERCPICGCRLIRVMEIPRMLNFHKDAIPKAA